jgi:hypothetical protein
VSGWWQAFSAAYPWALLSAVLVSAVMGMERRGPEGYGGSLPRLLRLIGAATVLLAILLMVQAIREAAR